MIGAHFPHGAGSGVLAASIMKKNWVRKRLFQPRWGKGDSVVDQRVEFMI